eukprot:10404294-Karenia_brevis.AAC.1
MFWQPLHQEVAQAIMASEQRPTTLTCCSMVAVPIQWCSASLSCRLVVLALACIIIASCP